MGYLHVTIVVQILLLEFNCFSPHFEVLIGQPLATQKKGSIEEQVRRTPLLQAIEIVKLYLDFCIWTPLDSKVAILRAQRCKVYMCRCSTQQLNLKTSNRFHHFCSTLNCQCQWHVQCSFVSILKPYVHKPHANFCYSKSLGSG